MLEQNLARTTVNKVQSAWQSFARCVSQGLSDSFYKLGHHIASHPWTTICITLVGFLLTILGFVNFTFKGQYLDILIPGDSKFANDTKWFLNSFDEVVRHETIIIRADNVLVPSVLEKAALITNEILKVIATDQHSNVVRWEDVCLKIPILIFYTSENDDDDDGDDSDEDDQLESEEQNTTVQYRPPNPSVDWNATFFCDFVSKLPTACFQANVLDIWKNNRTRIQTLSQDEILQRINQVQRSPVTGHSTDYRHMLGDITRTSSGRISAAGSLMIRFTTQIKVTDAEHNEIIETKLGFDENWVTDKVFLWEGAFNAKMADLALQFTDEETTVLYSAARSTSDSSVNLFFSSLTRMLSTSMVMFVFLQLVLSRPNWIELRVVVGCTGLICVVLALVSGFGLASGLGFIMTNTHSCMPFLVMGLGVDDMFVIMASAKRHKLLHPDRPTAELIAVTMKNAGTSITITSLTDILVFLVGMTTDIPFLKSYCVYAALCISMVYVYVITFFVAVLALDERRIKGNKNAIFPCIVHAPVAEQVIPEDSWLERAMGIVYSKIVFTTIGKVLIVTITVLLTGISIDSVLKLQQQFDVVWFIPEHTYHHRFLMAQRTLYPDLGQESFVVIRSVNYKEEFGKIMDLSAQIEGKTNVLHDVHSWVRPFQKFVWTYHEKNLTIDPIDDAEWRKYLSQFLFSTEGGEYQANFRFKEKLKCGQAVPDIKISTIDFKFKNFQERDDYLAVKQDMEDTVRLANFTSPESTVWSKAFILWILNSVIDAEIYRNIAMGLVAVMLCTAILIVNFQMCFWILLCIVLSLINIGGFMRMWGLSLDLLTCIALQMSVGLCVDYAAHVGHAFLATPGDTPTARALKSVQYIGPAVVYGGLSTVIVFSSLGTIDSYGYQVFFKIFMLVVLFGFFYGLLLLPVILSVCGPEPYREHKGVAANEAEMKVFTVLPHIEYSTKL